MSAPKLRCSKCKQPLQVEDVKVAVVTDTDTELNFACTNKECLETFCAWIPHNRGWANSESEPVNLLAAKGGRS